MRQQVLGLRLEKASILLRTDLFPPPVEMGEPVKLLLRARSHAEHRQSDVQEQLSRHLDLYRIVVDG